MAGGWLTLLRWASALSSPACPGSKYTGVLVDLDPGAQASRVQFGMNWVAQACEPILNACTGQAGDPQVTATGRLLKPHRRHRRMQGELGMLGHKIAASAVWQVPA